MSAYVLIDSRFIKHCSKPIIFLEKQFKSMKNVILSLCHRYCTMSGLTCHVMWPFHLQADINTNVQDEQGAFYGVNSQYEANENITITCSTKVCSFGKQVVEKVEVSTLKMHHGFTKQNKCTGGHLFKLLFWSR